MRPEDATRLRHMAEAAESALAFTRDRTRADLDDDRLLSFGLARANEILGEAAAQLSEEARRSLVGVPWAPMRGMRNRLVHAYFEIDLDIVWSTATEELPRLLPLLRAALAEDGAGGE